MTQQHTGDITDIRTTREQYKESIRIDINDYELIVPKEVLRGLPEDVLNDGVRLREYLLSALKIGVQAMANAGISLSTDNIENALRTTVIKYEDFDKQFEEKLSNLIETKLTGDDSLLARKLAESFGESGDLDTRLSAIFDDIANPEKAKSVPNRVTEVMQDKFDGVEEKMASALDLTGQNSPLKQFLDEQQRQFNKLNEDLRKDLDSVKSALNVDEILQAKELEIAELKDKSTHKGIHFENDAVDALQNIADVLGDRIEHTGGEGEGASRSKVGDIVIIIQHQGVPDLRIAVEAKAGGISRKEMIRQVRSGVENRNASRGIGLMERKHMGQTQHIIGQEGENYIVGVDWANDDFLSLEVTYRMLRSVMIADALRIDGSESIDIDAIKKRLVQAKTDLGLLQSMKSQTSTAIGTLEGVRSNMDVMEKKVKAQLSEAESFLTEE